MAVARRASLLLGLVATAAGVVACGAGDGDEARTTRTGPPTAGQLELASLTDAQVAGQRLVVTFSDVRVPGPAILGRIRRGELAGVILFAPEAPDVRAARRLADRLQREARRSPIPLPLLVMIDQEGGDGSTTGARRLRDAPPRRSAAQQAGGGVRAAQASGREAGWALRRAGVNVNLAPVADVGRRDAAITREGRSYGATARVAGRLAGAFVSGQRSSGVAATLKHFPGFGGARLNTDAGPATIALSAGVLRAVDEAAFVPGVRAGAQLVMLSNAVYPALDEGRPAAFSRRIAIGELRERLGFAGVTVTDDLEADALRAHGTVAQRALRSVSAGVDLALLGRHAASGIAAHRALTSAVRSGRLPRAEAEQGAARVLALRARLPR